MGVRIVGFGGSSGKGCACCGCSVTTICASDCSGNSLVGATVDVISGGSTIGSCTTGSGGCCTISPAITPGTYEVKITESGGTVFYDGPVTMGCSIAIGGCCARICVTGCSANIDGATVTISRGGSTVSSGDTDSSGCVTLPIPAAGSYTVTVSAAGFQTSTGSYSLTCFNVSRASTNIALTIASGYTCSCLSSSCPVMPTTLTGSDGLGSFTLTYDVGSGTWIGCAMRNFTGCSVPSTTTNCSGVSPTFGTVSIPVFFTFICRSDGTFAMSAVTPLICGDAISGIDCSFVGGFTTLINSSCTIAAPISCTPFDWTASIPGATGFPGWGCVGCTSTGTCVSGGSPCNNNGGDGAPACRIYGCGGVTFTVTP